MFVRFQWVILISSSKDLIQCVLHRRILSILAMLRQNKSILGFLTVAFCVASANGAKRGYKPPAEEKRVSGKDVRDMTKLLEHQCPFPEETMAKNCRISCLYAGALARATSLHQTCVYYLLILLSFVLNAVQVRYGGILGKFPNLLMIQHVVKLGTENR